MDFSAIVANILTKSQPAQPRPALGFDEQNIGIDGQASNQFVHNWRQTITILVVPGIISLGAVVSPEYAGWLIEKLWSFFVFVLVIGIALTYYRGIRF